MRRSVVVCGPTCSLNNSAIELNLRVTKPAGATRGMLTLVVFAALLVAAGLQAHAQTETVLYSFAGAPSDGANPWVKPAFDEKGNLYGTTLGGGAYNYGSVYKLEPSGTETILHSFDSDGSDGYSPYAGLVSDNGIIYGATQLGGAYGQGTVFELTPTKNGWTETILHSFALNGTDGAEPFAGLVLDKEGNLYGTTYEGGEYNQGTVFKLTPSGTETILHSFDFNGLDGYYPDGTLVLDGKGNLYGTTTYGGPYGCNEDGCGTVFELTPSGKERILHSFGASGDGSNPYGSLVPDKMGNLYGTTDLGGAYNYGTVFELTLSHGTWTETILHSFDNNGTDGTDPAAGLVFDANGNLYGTTIGGGAYNYGTVFELSPPSGGSGLWAETILWSFGSGTDGHYPEASLIFHKDGNLYGTTSYGGAYGGTLFVLTP